MIKGCRFNCLTHGMPYSKGNKLMKEKQNIASKLFGSNFMQKYKASGKGCGETRNKTYFFRKDGEIIQTKS